MKSRIKKKKEKRKCGYCREFSQFDPFCSGTCWKTGSNRWSTDNACLLFKLEKEVRFRVK